VVVVVFQVVTNSVRAFLKAVRARRRACAGFATCRAE
jgi:hypothetical protein